MLDMEQIGYFLYMQEQEQQEDDIKVTAESDNDLVAEWDTKQGSEIYNI